MNQKLHKAILGILGTAVMAGISSEAFATGVAADLSGYVGNASGYNTATSAFYVWDGGNIGYGNAIGKGDCATNDCGNLPVAGRGRIGGADPMSGSVQDDRNMGWNHTTKWYTFQISSEGGYTISWDRPAGANTNNQPAFSVWSSGADEYGNENNSHKFNQVRGPVSVSPDLLNTNGGHADNGNDYMLPDDDGGNELGYITGFVGYANAGATYVNANGDTVKGALALGTSTEGTLTVINSNVSLYSSVVTKGAYTDAHAGEIAAAYAGVGSSVNTGNATTANGGHADLQLWLTPGWYVMTGGGSCADFTCTATSGNGASKYNIKILANSAVSAPAAVPVPAAVWLFGSALAGMGGVGRRKGKVAV